MLQLVFILFLAVRAHAQPDCGDVFDACNLQYGNCFGVGGPSYYYCSDECRRQIGGCSLAFSNYAEVSSICSLATSTTCDNESGTGSGTESGAGSGTGSDTGSPTESGTESETGSDTGSGTESDTGSEVEGSETEFSNTFKVYNSILLWSVSGVDQGENRVIASCRYATCNSGNTTTLASRVRRSTCSKILGIEGIIKSKTDSGFVSVGANGITCSDRSGIRKIKEEEEEHYVYVSEASDIDFSDSCDRTSELGQLSSVIDDFLDVCEQVNAESGWTSHRTCNETEWNLTRRKEFGSNNTCAPDDVSPASSTSPAVASADRPASSADAPEENVTPVSSADTPEESVTPISSADAPEESVTPVSSTDTPRVAPIPSADTPRVAPISSADAPSVTSIPAPSVVPISTSGPANTSVPANTPSPVPDVVSSDSIRCPVPWILLALTLYFGCV